MRFCKECAIEVGGEFEKCPLCGSPLEGEASEKYWPAPEKLKKRSRLFKRQLLVVIMGTLIYFFIDLFFVNAPFPMLGLFILMWTIVGEVTLYQFVKRHRSFPGIFLGVSVGFVVGITLSTFWIPVLVAVIPIPLMSILGMNFVMTICMRKGNVMLNFIIFFLTGIISWAFIMLLMRYRLTVLWNVSFIVSMGTLLVTLIVRGRDLKRELQKRFML